MDEEKEHDPYAAYRVPEPPAGATYPKPISKRSIPKDYTADKYQQQPLEKAPLRAIAIKGQQLRAAMRAGKQLDWVDIHERFVDLWQEARLSIWRCKHKKAGVKTYDPHLKKEVMGYVADENMILKAIDTTRGVLDSIVKLRREMGHDSSGIPRWAIERIERALRLYPEAQHALLKELAAENEKMAEPAD
jgi:hypothetical protein